MTNYKAIIFDLGNVVFNCSFNETLTYWASISNLDIDYLNKILDLDTDYTHSLFEKASVTSSQFRDYISQKIGYPLTAQEFENGWNAIYKEKIAGIEELLIDLKKLYRIIALTNTNEIHSNIWITKYRDTLKYFEKVFASNEIKTRKPESDAFQICLDYLEMQPNETVFLDDKLDYINGAKRLGIKSILVKSFDQMLIELKKVGIKTAGNSK